MTSIGKRKCRIKKLKIRLLEMGRKAYNRGMEAMLMNFEFNSPEGILFIVSSILILPAIIFAMWAQFRVMSAFNKYSNEMSMTGETGHTVARRLLDANGCGHVKVEHTRGHLSDHYDPRKKVVRLSEAVYNSSSLAALGVAAHEVGHAIQDHTNYPPLKIRQIVIKTTRLVNFALLPLIIIGFIGMFVGLAFVHPDFFFWFVIALAVMYGISVLVNLITLPTEFDASKRARAILDQERVITDQSEMDGVRRVLGAAALTYVAALVVSLVYFLRFLSLALIMAGRRR